jgi:hypothetical protein
MVFLVFSNNLTDAEFSRYTKTQATNGCSGTKVGELVGMISYVLLWTRITVYKGLDNGVSTASSIVTQCILDLTVLGFHRPGD